MKKVLFVEDFLVMHDLYRDVFVKAGYMVNFAQDGTDALKKLEETKYDFIFVDMLLPNMNGIEFLEAYSDRPAKTKIYALSDFSDSETIERAKELGVEDYLRKTDYPPSKLVELLDGLEKEKS